MTESKSLALDLLYQLESILESDPLIDEVGFIHPSQFVALIENSGAPFFSSPKTVGQSANGIIESQVSGVSPTDMVFWTRDHKLGISTQALNSLYTAAKHSFMASYEQYTIPSSSLVKKDGSGNKNLSSSSSSSLDILESEVMKHSRVLLLLSCDFGTAWNLRKEVVSKKQQFPIYVDELLLSELVLSYAPKSERAWSHRRWVIKMIAGKWSNLQEIVQKESELVKRLAEKSKMNYRAWNHRSWLVSYMPRRQVLDEWINNRDWAGLHVADNSCFHYRTRLMLRMLEDSCHKQNSAAFSIDNAELYLMWQEELDWDAILIRRYIGREALWLYRRFLSLCWIKHFATNATNVSNHPSHKSSTCTDFFMESELQFVRSCSSITDNLFDDYQSQAKFSATYILWMIKQIHESPGVEPQGKLGQEVEALLLKGTLSSMITWLRTQYHGERRRRDSYFLHSHEI